MPLISGVRAVAFGLENVLLANLIPETLSGARDTLFRRMIFAPKTEPLSPLLENRQSAVMEAAQILAPFYEGHPSGPPPLDSLYSGYTGRLELASWIQTLRDDGIQVGVWDHCLAGTTQRVHSLLDGYYPGLFPKRVRILSTRHEAQLGEEKMLRLVLTALQAGPDDLLVVTSNPGHRDLAVRSGIRCLLFDARQDAGTVSLGAALNVHLGLSDPAESQVMKDPSAYLLRVGKAAGAAADDPAFKELMVEISQCQSSGPIETDFRCLAIDRRRAEFPAPLPRFKSRDEVVEDAHRLIDGYLGQIERKIPALARTAMMGLMAELTALCRLSAASFPEIGAISELAEKAERHIRENRNLYVDQVQVFHQDEWEAIVGFSRDDDDALDRRYADWVDGTYRLMREMAAESKPIKAIRRMVKERLLEDLVLGMMELEMIKRSLRSVEPRHRMFPQHHDAKNRVASLTANIEDKESWKRTATLYTKSLQGWVRALTLRHLRTARECGTKLSFTFEMDADLPPAELADFSEAQRESVDHILTELVRNALKYRNPRSASKAAVHMIEGENAVAFRVSDNGLGIHDLQAVLAGGVREHPEVAEGYGGGLASVRQHVEKHPNWSFQIESKPGEGTSVRIVIPLSPDSRRNRLSDSGFPKGG